MLVNKTVEFFLSEVVGLGEMPAGAEAGLAADRCWTGGGTSRDRVGGKSPGQAAGLEQDAEAGLAAEPPGTG